MADLSDLLNKVKRPQGPSAGPQGTATAPQVTETAPQGTATVPQSTQTAPTGGGAAFQGGQAELIIQGDKVLKVYKKGFGYNAAVLPLVKQLKGKGYLVDLYDFGAMDYQGEQRKFELMEYCPAGAVSAFDLKEDKEAILKIALKTALSIDACHRLGFVHKDVKPANILVRDPKTWDCVLCDFGIADVLENGKAASVQERTPIYAPPEMYERHADIGGSTYYELTPASDFYSLGMTILCLWYGESAFRRKETIMAIQKVHDGIAVPSDMPDPLYTITRGLLVKDPAHRWGLKEIRDFMNGKKVPVFEGKKKGALEIVFNGGKNQVAHSLEELAALMVADSSLAVKYLYSGKISKWLESLPEVQVEMDKIVETDFPDDQAMGFLAAVHLLNPFYDLNLCCNLNAPDYAMTGEAIGRWLNDVYYLYFTKYDADFNNMSSHYNDSDRQLVRSPGIAYNVAYSFMKGSNADYLPWFFDHKGKRFEQQRKWFNYCVAPPVDDRKKAGPKDKRYRNQVAMMKTIAGFGAVPEYRLSRTGEVLRNLNDFNAAPKRELQFDLQHDKGLRGWLAVQCHENPHDNLKPKYTYEKLLEQYLGLIGAVDKDDEAYNRFVQARDVARNISAGAKSRIRGIWTLSALQKAMVFALAFLPLALLSVDIILNLIDNPVLDLSNFEFNGVFYVLAIIAAAISYFAGDSDGCLVPVIIGVVSSFAVFLVIRFLGGIVVWIYLLAVLAVLVFFSIKTLFVFSPFKQKSKSILNPGFEELTLEPLHFAFSDERRFDSSLNGAVDERSIEKWKADVRKRWSFVLIFIGSTIVLVFFRFLLPSSERMDHFDQNLKRRIGIGKATDSIMQQDTVRFEDAVQELPETNPKQNRRK